MAMNDKSSSQAKPAGIVAGKIDWAALAPKSVDYEDTMSERRVNAAWQKMFALGGLRNPGEETQASFKLAVFVYLCVNGTSAEGNYAGSMWLSDGTEVSASVIPQAVGAREIRRFMRGNSELSYYALKQSRVMEKDEKWVTKCSQFGATAANCFAVADWFSGCPLLTPQEKAVHEANFTYSVSRARRARGGRTLEEVYDDRNKETLEANGPMVASHGGHDVQF